MQEPILFNATIKENILYGELNASDEEVYKAALKANAVGFIEGQTADMKQEEEEKYVKDNLKTKIVELEKSYGNFFELDQDTKHFTLVQKKLILEVLSNGDDKVLKLINAKKHAFLALVETFGETAGIKWDDLIIKFEWTFNVEAIL